MEDMSYVKSETVIEDKSSAKKTTSIFMEILKGIGNLITAIMRLFVVFLFVVFVAICTHPTKLYEIIFPEAKYAGVYTIGTKDSDDLYQLTLESRGTAIIGDKGSEQGKAFIWDVKRIQGKEYVILRTEDAFDDNLYLCDDKIYNSEFELRRGTDNYEYTVTDKRLYNDLLSL